MMALQWAQANLPARDKDEDAVFIHSLPAGGGLLVGVADGISAGNGRAASRWIAQTMAELAIEEGASRWDARQLFNRFAVRLASAAEASMLADSHSTLSCGIARALHAYPTPAFRFDFFGIGDSPIWRIVRPKTPNFGFQASVVYASPVPSEISGLYSWVNLGRGRVEGQVHFGSVDLDQGELLIVSSDGVPESRVLIDDQDRDNNRGSPRLIDRLLRAAEIDDAMLLRILKDYDQQRMLVDDDASLAVVRLAPDPDDVSGSRVAGDAAEAVMEPIHEPESAQKSPPAEPTAAPVADELTIQGDSPQSSGLELAVVRKSSESGKGRKVYPKNVPAAERKERRAQDLNSQAAPKAKAPAARKQPSVGANKANRERRKG